MKQNGCWISQMADTLTCEIIGTMSGIQLSRCCEPTPSGTEMSAVFATVEGQMYDMQLQFRAEPRMFLRLARNMIGGEPEDFSEVEDYAAEFFNVLCGRFVSELCRISRTTAKFTPTKYEPVPRELGTEKGRIKTLYFVSENQERAQFSWGHFLVHGN